MKLNEVWYVNLPNAVCLSKQIIKHITNKVVELQPYATIIDGSTTAYVKSDVEFVDRIGVLSDSGILQPDSIEELITMYKGYNFETDVHCTIEVLPSTRKHILETVNRLNITAEHYKIVYYLGE